MAQRIYRIHDTEHGVIVKVGPDGRGVPIAECVHGVGCLRENADFIADVLESHAALLAAVKAVVGACRAYLPPDGIGRDPFIQRVLEATDNADIVWALETADPAFMDSAVLETAA